MDTDAILGLLQEAAETLITPRFRALRDDEIEAKTSPDDLVTIADKEAEVFISERLRDAFPDALVIGEEAAFADPGRLGLLPNADHAFVIDPVDGTRNFARGRVEHGVMLAETRGGITTRGWIWQPQTGRAYVVERGSGVLLNGEPISANRPSRLPLGATSRDKVQGFTADGRLSPVTRSKFACCFDYPSLLEGGVDFLFYINLRPWDHLAGSLMVTETGGVSRTVDGLNYSVLSRSRGLIVASDAAVWMAAQQYWPVPPLKGARPEPVITS